MQKPDPQTTAHNTIGENLPSSGATVTYKTTTSRDAWRTLYEDEKAAHRATLELLREVCRDGILPPVLRQKVWSATNV